MQKGYRWLLRSCLRLKTRWTRRSWCCQRRRSCCWDRRRASWCWVTQRGRMCWLESRKPRFLRPNTVDMSLRRYGLLPSGIPRRELRSRWCWTREVGMGSRLWTVERVRSFSGEDEIKICSLLSIDSNDLQRVAHTYTYQIAYRKWDCVHISMRPFEHKVPRHESDQD